MYRLSISMKMALSKLIMEDRLVTWRSKTDEGIDENAINLTLVVDIRRVRCQVFRNCQSEDM